MRISDWSSDVCSSDLLRQGRVDGRGKGVDELGPFGAEQPQGAAAMLAEMPLGRAGMGARLAGAFYFCVVDGYVSSPPDLHGPGVAAQVDGIPAATLRSEEHTSELQSLMRISYAVFCLKKKKITQLH